MCINGFILFARRGGPPTKNFKGADRGDSQGKFNPVGAALNVVGSVKNAIDNAANSITQGLQFNSEVPGQQDPEETDPVLYYPSTLQDNANRPQIKFSCIERAPGADTATSDDISELFFPCPANIAFADQGNYNVLDLGVLAAGLLSEDAGGGAGQVLLDTALAGGTSVLKEAGLQKQVDAVLFGAKKIANPFQNTQFVGNNIRNFTFNFKMIAKTQQDAYTINKIHRKFRAKTYASKGNDNSSAFLKYPPIWEIDFIHGHDDAGFKKNPYMPEINLCYLTTVNTTFNTTAAAWAPTGAPIEVDISLTFQETRANERNDILGLAAADFAGMASARQYDRTRGTATNLYAVGERGNSVPINMEGNIYRGDDPLNELEAGQSLGVNQDALDRVNAFINNRTTQ